MFVADSIQMRNIDSRAMNKYGIPGVVLMENAAFLLLNKVKEMLDGRKAVIACGGGNNGGDGFALSRLLYSEGYEVSVYCFGNKDKLKGDALVNYNIIQNMNMSVKDDIDLFREELKSDVLIVDALLGTGLSGEVREPMLMLINIINNSGREVLSVDIPSGISSDTGEILGAAVKAIETVTFCLPKYGHIVGEGRKHTGKLTLGGISIPQECVIEENIKTTVNDDRYPLNILRTREIDANKGTFGRVYIAAGSTNMPGAAAIAAKAALRAGAGLVTLVIPESIKDRLGVNAAEATYLYLKDDEARFMMESRGKGTDCMYLKEDGNKYSILDETMKKADSIGMGPGLGWNEVTEAITCYVIRNYNGPLVLDADSLNSISEYCTVLKERKGATIITPHPGEMARLIKKDVSYINSNRISSAQRFSQEYGSIVLLKGSSTIVTDGVRTYINTTGNPGMAKGGSGDALTGIITSLCAQGYEAYEAACLGAYIHGRAGDEAYKSYGYGLTASDLIDKLKL